MKEHPILFSGEMVRAILDGRKTQTRRVMNPQPDGEDSLYPNDESHVEFSEFINQVSYYVDCGWCKYGKPGDHLWVREAFAGVNNVIYKADEWQGKVKWTPGIYMPRTTSRITLEIVSVRVQRVQDISEDDSRAEGIEAWTTNTLRMGDPNANKPLFRPEFPYVWDSINAKRGFGWDVNPYVWVIEFKRI